MSSDQKSKIEKLRKTARQSHCAQLEAKFQSIIKEIPQRVKEAATNGKENIQVAFWEVWCWGEPSPEREKRQIGMRVFNWCHKQGYQPIIEREDIPDGGLYKNVIIRLR